MEKQENFASGEEEPSSENPSLSLSETETFLGKTLTALRQELARNIENLRQDILDIRQESRKDRQEIQREFDEAMKGYSLNLDRSVKEAVGPAVENAVSGLRKDLKKIDDRLSDVETKISDVETEMSGMRRTVRNLEQDSRILAPITSGQGLRPMSQLEIDRGYENGYSIRPGDEYSDEPPKSPLYSRPPFYSV